MPYLSALEVCSRRGAIQIHVYLYLYLPEDVIHERRLYWCGNVWRMSADIPARTAITWFSPDGTRKIGHPYIDWMQMMKQDISREGFS